MQLTNYWPSRFEYWLQPLWKSLSDQRCWVMLPGSSSIEKVEYGQGLRSPSLIWLWPWRIFTQNKNYFKKKLYIEHTGSSGGAMRRRKYQYSAWPSCRNGHQHKPKLSYLKLITSFLLYMNGAVSVMHNLPVPNMHTGRSKYFTWTISMEIDNLIMI